MSRLTLTLLLLACSRSAPPVPRGADAGPPDPLAMVVDPWTWPRAQGATARDRAIEDLGPHEPLDPNDPRSPAGSVNGHHWTRLVDLPWDREVTIHLDRAPVDLDGDGVADTTVTRHVSAPGGILANPTLFGLVPTPDDPRGRIGRVSASTGVLGLREALDREGRRTGLIGMTCWLCHAGQSRGRIVYGMPATGFDYGLLLATAALLDDPRRGALGFPTGNAARARLLTAGPGRQDLTAEFGLDLGVPGLHSARYTGVTRLRQGHRGVVNPLSVPPLFRTAGLSLQNWSGSEAADDPWLERLAAQTGDSLSGVRAAFGLPAGDLALARRALLLDLRNLGTLGLQQDSFPGLLWSEALRERVKLPAAALRAIPGLYAAREVRAMAESASEHLARLPQNPDAVARGRVLFSERIVGTVANRQLLRTVPAPYRPARLPPPLIAPIDPGRPLGALIPVRCADCHSGAPLETKVAIEKPPLGRCSHCHWGHPEESREFATAARALHAAGEVTSCTSCHRTHAALGPVAYSSGWLLPFDSDGDGNAQGDEVQDGRAGGIGTEALLSFDVPLPDRHGAFGVRLAVIGDARRAGPVIHETLGVAWVRVAPLVGVSATAPYLHNGSVPSLRALLDPAPRRPVVFRLVPGPFLFDTRVPGNRNLGHEYGTALTPREKDDLVAFLETL